MADLTLYDHRTSICSQMARLALVEKGLPHTRRSVDIMETNEQFEPWYVALNPKAVVPTLKIGADEIVTDTKRIVRRIDEFEGPDLSGDETAQDWLDRIMSLHYGVLLYRKRLDPDGTAPQVVARGNLLRELATERPDLKDLIAARLDGNARFQKILKDPALMAPFVDEANDLLAQMSGALADQAFLAGPRYSVADCFATAALARFTIHGFAEEWAGGPLEGYYARMKARPSFVAAEVVDTGTEADL